MGETHATERVLIFYGKEKYDEPEDKPWFKNDFLRRCFSPEHGRDKYLDSFILYINKVKTEVINVVKDRVQPNLTKVEKNAIIYLLNDPTIVIRQADKRSGVVVEDAESYIEKLEKEIGNFDTYQLFDSSRKQKEL